MSKYYIKFKNGYGRYWVVKKRGLIFDREVYEQWFSSSSTGLVERERCREMIKTFEEGEKFNEENGADNLGTLLVKKFNRWLKD